MEDFDSDKLWNFWRNDRWDFDEILPTVGSEIIQLAIEHAPILRDYHDVLFWKLTSSGLFSISSA